MSISGLQPTSAIILLAGIYYGAMYGGSTTSILMRIPGEAASVMTCIDGYAMARKGRAGPALAIAAIGSFIAGTVSVIGLMFLAPTLATFALGFGPPEYFCLLVCGLVVLSYMTGGSIVKNLAMICLGLMAGMIGIDQMSGYFRFSYGVTALGDGIGLVPVAVGLFGISDILATAGSQDIREVLKPRLRDLLPSREEFKDSIGPIGRGTVLGFLIGIIPGSAHIISTFVSYAMERRISKHPERFGKGAIEGVAGPESANNAASEGALVPLLALGVPTGPIPAVLLAALMVHGITPGPLVHQGAAGGLLGPDREHVCRQSGAAAPQPADGGHLRQFPAHSLPHPLPDHPAVLRGGRLCGQFEHDRRDHHERDGPFGIPVPEIGF